MSSETPTLRLEQMKYRDIPWHFRAASTLGSQAQNLNTEINRAFATGALSPTRANKIRRRCETDAIEFGAYISLRWLLEFCGIKFQPRKDGPQKLKVRDDKNYMLSDYSEVFRLTEEKLGELETRFPKISFRDAYTMLCQFSAHPSKDFQTPKISVEMIDGLLDFIERRLAETIYKTQDLKELCFVSVEEDKTADTNPIQ